MHFLIGAAILIALFYLIRLLYYATVVMRPEVELMRAQRRLQREQQRQWRIANNKPHGIGRVIGIFVCVFLCGGLAVTFLAAMH